MKSAEKYGWTLVGGALACGFLDIFTKPESNTFPLVMGLAAVCCFLQNK